jgi:hypothetical protein
MRRPRSPASSAKIASAPPGRQDARAGSSFRIENMRRLTEPGAGPAVARFQHGLPGRARFCSLSALLPSLRELGFAFSGGTVGSRFESKSADRTARAFDASTPGL